MKYLKVFVICTLISGVLGASIGRTLVAKVTYVGDDTIIMDTGSSQGIKTGLLGHVYYKMRIAKISVTSVKPDESIAKVESKSADIKPGQLVEFVIADEKDWEARAMSLKMELDETRKELLARRSANESLEAALKGLRKEVNTVVSEKTGNAQEELSLVDLTDSLQKEMQAKEIEITELRGRLAVNLMDNLLFDPGKTRIKKAGGELLGKIAKNLLNRYPDRDVLVEGHTDNIPIGRELSARFPTNWEFSTARATAVVRYLQELGGVDPRRLSAVGYSQYRPIETNSTEAERAKNRRIEIILSQVPQTPVLPETIPRIMGENAGAVLRSSTLRGRERQPHDTLPTISVESALKSSKKPSIEIGPSISVKDSPDATINRAPAAIILDPSDRVGPADAVARPSFAGEISGEIAGRRVVFWPEPPKGFEGTGTGTATIKFWVDPAGSVIRVEISRKSGSPILDTKATDYVRQIRFEALPRNVQQKNQWGAMPIELRLTRGSR